MGAPTADLEALSGDWRLLYTTVTIRGSKRTKLGLRGMVTLGAFTQRIDAAGRTASNRVGFALSGGGAFQGALTIDAAFTVAGPKRCAARGGVGGCGVRCTAVLLSCALCFSPARVDIVYESSRLEPRQLQALFEANLALLLEVFNPQGWCAAACCLLLACLAVVLCIC